MAQTYTRQSTFADGDTITASLFNDEYNQLVNVFAYSSTDASSTGHRHDGTAAQGGNIPKVGDLDFLNKIEVDSTNNRWGFYVEVSSAAVEQIRIQDGAIVPVTDNDIDLGTSSLEFKDLYIDGTAYLDAINFNGTAITATAAELNIMDGVTATATEINLLDGVTSTTAELNILDGVTSTAAELNILDGVTSTAVELNILDGVTSTATELNIVDGDTTATSTTLADADRVVVNDAGTMVQVALTDFETYFESALDTLSNVTTVGALNAGSITSGFGAIDNGSSAITTTGTVTYGSLSDGTITVTAFVDEDDMSSDSATLVPTQQSVKAYVDAKVTAEDLDFQADSGGALSIDLDSETMTFTGGTGIDTSGSGNAVTFAIDSTVTTLTGSQTLTNKTLTSPDVNTPDIDGGTIDNTVIGGSTAAAGTFTTFTSTGIDDNASSTVMTIASSGETTFTGDVTISEATPAIVLDDSNNANAELRIIQSSGSSYYRARGVTGHGAHIFQRNNDGATHLNVFQANLSGDVIFYQNDGSTVGLTWDASASKLTNFASTGIDDNASSTAITIDSSQNTTFAGTITSGDITISEGTPLLRIQDTDGTNQYTHVTNINGNTYFGSRNDASDGNILIGGYGGNAFTEFARWSDTGHLTQKNNLIVQGTFTSLGIDDNATSTAITIDSNGQIMIAGSTTAFDTTAAVNGLQAHYETDTGQATLASYSAGGATFLTFYTNSSGGASLNRMIIDSNGWVNPRANVNADPANSQGLHFGWNFSGGAGESNIVFNKGAGNVGGLVFSDNSASGTPVERMRIDSTGNVGIGVTDPDNLLTVGGGTQPRILIRANGDSGASQFNFGDASDIDVGRLRYDHSDNSMSFFTSATERMRIDSSGNVGIGTDSPARHLHVNSGATLVTALFQSTGASAYVDFANSTTAQGRSRIGAEGTDTLVFKTVGSTAMTIDSSGNVGIGVTAGFLGSSTLALQRDYAIRWQDASNGTQYADIYGSSSSALVFRTGSSSAERMRIDSSGNVGIGTNVPETHLHIEGNAAPSIITLGRSGSNTAGNVLGALQFKNTDGSNDGPNMVANIQAVVPNVNGSGGYLKFGTHDGSETGGEGSSPVDRMIIDQDGNVLVGTAVTTINTTNFGTRISSAEAGYLASYRDVDGSGVAVLFGGNAGQVYVRGDGDLENTNNNYGAISDERLKSDIVDASSQINDIMAVQVRSYTLNETGATHIGVVAQELEASGMSGLVKTDEEGMKSVKYSILYMKAIKALQEAVTRIETLEAEVTALKGE